MRRHYRGFAPRPAKKRAPSHRRTGSSHGRHALAERTADAARWALGLVDEVDVLDRALDLTENYSVVGPLGSPDEIFLEFLGYRTPSDYSLRNVREAGVGSVMRGLGRFGARGSRTLAGLRTSLASVFRGAFGRAEELNHHVARRFLERCLSKGGELQGVRFSHLDNAIRQGRWFKDGQTGSVIAASDRVAIVMSVRSGGGKVVVRTIEPATQFVGRVNARFTPIAKPP